MIARVEDIARAGVVTSVDGDVITLMVVIRRAAVIGGADRITIMDVMGRLNAMTTKSAFYGAAGLDKLTPSDSFRIYDKRVYPKWFINFSALLMLFYYSFPFVDSYKFSNAFTIPIVVGHFPNYPPHTNRSAR